MVLEAETTEEASAKKASAKKASAKKASSKKASSKKASAKKASAKKASAKKASAKKASAKKASAKKASNGGSTGPEQRVQVASTDLPRITLEQTLPVPQVLQKIYAGKSASADEIAEALNVTETTVRFKYQLWAAQAYGLLIKEADGQFSLSETGRRIFAPTDKNEEKDAYVKAILTPKILSRFYTQYNGSSLPQGQYFTNVLASRFEVPSARVEEAKNLIIANGRFAGIFRERGSDVVVDLQTSSEASSEPPRAADEDRGAPNAGSNATVAPNDWDKTCFFITPIGEEGSDARKHSDLMLHHVLEPVLKEHGLTVVRADKIERTGLITKQVFEHSVYSALCIADLSFGNPNAFYELCARHMVKRAVIQIIRKGDRIPFDVAQGRTITIDTSDPYTVMDRVLSARNELKEHVRAILESSPEQIAEDNPVHMYLPGVHIKLDPPRRQ